MDCPQSYHCPVEATLDLIGGKYKTLILWHLAGGPQRFSQLQRLILRATPKMLTQQLRELEEDGLIHREVFPVVPPPGRILSDSPRRESAAHSPRHARLGNGVPAGTKPGTQLFYDWYFLLL